MGNAFRAVLAGGSGNKVIVTCAPQFAGATITCTNNTKTYTKTCPSTSPYTVEFKGLDVGTWTISGTIQGTVFTTTVEVQDVSAVLSYGFVWSTWVDTASQLDSTDYNTLDELLEDEKAVRELMLEHACVDYLSSFSNVTPNLEKVIENDICAKWINLCDYALDTCYANAALKAVMDEVDKYGYGEWVITDNTTTPPTWGPKGNVPVMTANNAPYGTVFGNGSYTDNPPYYAFDGNDSTLSSGIASASTSGAYIGYKFVNPVCAKRVAIKVAFAYSTQCIIQASNDGTTYTDLKEFTIVNTDGLVNVDFENDNYYLYYRIYQKSTTTAHRFGTSTIQFYGRELSVSVPTMTSNTSPYGEAFASSVFTTNSEYLLFANGDFTPSHNAQNPYCGYDFGKAIKIRKASFYFHSYNFGASNVINFRIIASNDKQTWENVSETMSATGFSNAMSWLTSAKIIVDVSPTIGYRYYAIQCDGVIIPDSNHMALPNSLQFYGLDYSEKEFEEGATKKWLYDHGVELETITQTVGTGGTIVKESDNIYIEANGILSYVEYSSVDLTNYNVMLAKCGKKYLTSTYEGLRVGNSAGVPDAVLNPITVPKAALSVVSFNEQKNLYVVSNSGTSGTKSYYSLAEWWLE